MLKKPKYRNRLIWCVRSKNWSHSTQWSRLNKRGEIVCKINIPYYYSYFRDVIQFSKFQYGWFYSAYLFMG